MRAREFTKKQIVDDYPPDQPTGPATPPEMPMGTVKVKVSDTQDWYQLGQDISNLKLANKAHYNQGPPQTVLVFGSEDEEHKYVKDLKTLGLPTTDIDPEGYDDVDENFADGRNPQDKGDSKRHGVPTKSSISTLRNVAKQGGRKGQLAHWMANMKAGKKNASK